MNIGIDVRKLRDYGIGTHIRNVVLHAARTDTENRYFLFCEPGVRDVADGPFTWIEESSPKYSLREHVSLSRKASEHDIALFHSPHYTLPYLLNCKSIVTIHDLIHLKFREFFPYWKTKAAEFLIQQAIKKADLVITVSKTSKEDILELFPASKGKIEVLYNRLSEEWLQPPQEMDLASLGISEDYLLYVGNFKKHKGIDTLIDAWSRIKDRPALVLAGKSSEMDADLQTKVFSHPGIRVLGFAGGTLLRNLYSKAMLFVFPSLYEGFGYPPLEAMLSGAPVLSSDAPALREILGKDADFFHAGNAEDLHEKLTTLIQDPARRTRHKTAAMKRAKSFVDEESPQKLLQIFRRVAQ
jgi:glycosyltransferase involved in cell wall biosynthesis